MRENVDETYYTSDTNCGMWFIKWKDMSKVSTTWSRSITYIDHPLEQSSFWHHPIILTETMHFGVRRIKSIKSSGMNEEVVALFLCNETAYTSEANQGKQQGVNYTTASDQLPFLLYIKNCFSKVDFCCKTCIQHMCLCVISNLKINLCLLDHCWFQIPPIYLLTVTTSVYFSEAVI